MLGRLMKYEIRATERIFLPLYGLILAFALVNRLLRAFNPEANDWGNLPVNLSAFLNGVTMTVYVLLVVALFVVTFVVTIQRFQKNLLGDEGYLMFTLPVKAHAHIDCRMIVTLMWTVLSLIVSALSIFILSVDESNMRTFSEWCLSMRREFAEHGASSWLILFECVVLLAVSILAGTLQLYAAIAVGNRSARHRQLAACGAYIGFGIVEQIITFGGFNALNGISPDSWLRAWLGGVARSLPNAALLEIALGLFILYCALFGLAFYALTNYLLSRKLNLE